MKKKTKRSGECYVYIVKCGDGTYYTGYTPDVKERIEANNAGRGAKYTRGRGTVSLVWSKRCAQLGEALKLENRIKRLTRQEKHQLVGSWGKREGP